MGDAKAITVRPISAADARDVVRRIHYSGTVVANSTLHLGVFLNGSLLGAMQFGSPMVRSVALGLVSGTGWNQMMELNRMAFDDRLPRNSESRAMGVAFRLIKRHRPDIKWILSFSDGTQCGDGAIYRASGFVLTAVKRSEYLFRMPDGTTATRMSLSPGRAKGDHWRKVANMPTQSANTVVDVVGGSVLQGYQLRYIKFLDPTWLPRLTVPVLPFSAIDDAGARMYRGSRPVSIGADAPPVQGGEGDQRSTTGLQGD